MDIDAAGLRVGPRQRFTPTRPVFSAAFGVHGELGTAVDEKMGNRWLRNGERVVLQKRRDI